MPVTRPETKFHESELGSVGYQVFGEGDRDILFITHWLSNVDMFWDEPTAVRYLDRLAEWGRVIMIDKLGSGVSDVSDGESPVAPVDAHLDYMCGVMDEVGSESAVLIGDTEGGMLAMLLAATYPDRFPALVLINSYARLSRADDYPLGAPPAAVERMRDQWTTHHGTTGLLLNFTAPSTIGDQRFLDWFVRFQRAAQKPQVARKAIQWIASTDVRPALSSIQAPTLVVNRRDATFHRSAAGRYLADHIEGARFVELPGADTLPFHAGDFDEVLDVVDEFLGSDTDARPSTRQLATVLFTDIVGSTALASEMGDRRWLDLMEEHDRLTQATVARFKGQVVKTTGDGALATFDGPHRAVQAAQVIAQDMDRLGLTIRAGVHTGEVERRSSDVGGLAIHLAARVMDYAEDGGIMATSTVKDLVAGSGLEFEQCGTVELRGVPGSWPLFEVR